VGGRRGRGATYRVVAIQSLTRVSSKRRHTPRTERPRSPVSTISIIQRHERTERDPHIVEMVGSDEAVRLSSTPLDEFP
jgi:hypothetical protein